MQSNYQFRKATLTEIPQIWEILKQAIQRRKEEGSNQWQDGYPNQKVIQNDIENGYGFVLTEKEVVIGYTAVLINDEPEYERIVGKWQTNSDFVVYHRVAIAEKNLGKGLAKIMLGFIETFALENNIYSVKADTNFDNKGMLAIFERLGYVYCGEVYFRGSARKAYEKVLLKAI
ncbi:GNAT family N-acetyltransferase [Flavobacterium jejuense]|uniref:GNAT family N-acetyltransferase n=1 Tax=Flavobacterium jejuense TaxID=1544455 RepID=A0ABX0IUP3_9FLAO|nr:GNAT family N-acetyltransferase [Flavobacterium jejuense]NHN27527.1 GNAT family N-acetyltransferase [Flavobacterium jejuense]